MPQSIFQRLAPASDPVVANDLLQLLSSALSQEGLANYFTRRNEAAAARLWAELLHLTLAASTRLGQPQLFYLADHTAAAVVQHFPEDRAGWHRSSALVRLAKVAPWGKWRALREALLAADRQKAAFAASHGPFLYLAALGVAPEFRSAGLGSVLLDHICRMADERSLCVYAEASSDRMRRWLRASGFSEQMSHSVRPHAPMVVVMVRVPSAQQDRAGHRGSSTSGTANGGAGGGSSGGGASGAGSSTGQQQAPQQQPPAQARPRPAGSVRTR